METPDSLLTSPILNAIGVGVGLIGIILAYVFYRKGRRVKEPCWAIRNTNLIRGYVSRFTDLRVLYRGQEVEDISVARIVFWNRGTETIQRHDIADANPLRFVGIERAKFLDVKLLENNNEPSRFSVSLANDGSGIHVEFDYLDQDQGGVFQVVHTGRSAEDIQLIGSVKGVKNVARVSVQSIESNPLPFLAKFLDWETRRKIALLPWITFLASGIGIFFFKVSASPDIRERVFNGVVLLLAVGLLITAVPGLRRQVPAGLETFGETLVG